MLLRQLRERPDVALRYMERFVNDGSPSGFTKRYTTSEVTSPFGTGSGFRLFIARASAEQFTSRGTIPRWPAEPFNDDEWILIHPDMAKDPDLATPGVALRKADRYRVTPTASGRTVQFDGAPTNDYVKLHYAGILGRVDRSLPFRAAISGPEVSAILTAAVDTAVLDDCLAFFPEPGGRVLTVAGGREWGMTWRSCIPAGRRASQISCLIPVFSLFSQDLNSAGDPPLLAQLIDRAGQPPAEYIIADIIEPMVRAYFRMIRDIGLQPEWNAQNLLLGITADSCVAAFVMRDLESVDKDITLRQRYGLDCSFESAPHKCINDAQYNYRIKHSFMFDYKFCGYIIEPLLRLVATRYAVNYDELVERVRTLVDLCVADLPSDFFPEDNCWYEFASVLIDQSQAWRPYVSHPNPAFRSERH